MKFSWKLINNFVNISHIPLKKFTNKLTLSGIEVEEITAIDFMQDTIFDVSITANRKEICSIMAIAKEISIIFKTPLIINPINIFQKSVEKRNNKSDTSKYINIIINEITNIHSMATPLWISNYLEINNINNINVLKNIKEYIKIKWGHSFYIFNKNQLLEKINSLQIKPSKIINSITLNYNENTTFFLFTMEGEKVTTKLAETYSEYYLNAYIDTIRIISTLTKCKLGKSHNIFNVKNDNTFYRTIEIQKNIINDILGPVIKESFQQISYKEILSTLNQLNLYPKYNSLSKTFKVMIPINRNHDLKRPIDIIEEIGRVKGFNYFMNKMPRNQEKGNISKILTKTRKIRQILRHLGLNEVINCCLINNNFKNRNIKLYNPISQEQSELRNNILQGLINNYIHNNNSVSNNNVIEIFEIGKVFKQKYFNQYNEEVYIGGLINNNRFIRNNWLKKTNSITFFHLKGLLEFILEQVNAQVNFGKIGEYNNTKQIENTRHFFHEIKQIGIYNKDTKEIIGILGEINPFYTKNVYQNKNPVYIFEININKLYTSTSLNKHLNYNIIPYSNYPNVTRDISINIEKQKNIQEITNVFIKQNNRLVKSVDVFNEYCNKESNIRSISLRITYGSNQRTLDKNDIKKIDQEIDKFLLKFKSKT